MSEMSRGSRRRAFQRNDSQCPGPFGHVRGLDSSCTSWMIMLLTVLIALGVLFTPAPAEAFGCKSWYDNYGTRHRKCVYPTLGTSNYRATFSNGTHVNTRCQSLDFASYTRCTHYTNGSYVKTCKHYHSDHFFKRGSECW